MNPPPSRNVRSFAEIKLFLDTLSPPAVGKVRMYRGQTKEYLRDDGSVALIPALARQAGSPMYDPGWLASMAFYVAGAFPEDGSVRYESMQVWSPALIQHYGPGSYFIDVTHDVETALWFSRHEYHERWIALKEGVDPKDLRDIYHSVSWSTGITGTGGPVAFPVIYVLDLDPWNGVAVPKHCQLVDLLALEPSRQIAEKAMRIRAQSAGLVYSDPTGTEGHNLHTRISARIFLGPEFTFEEAVASRRNVAQLYPPPPLDAFYDTLIRAPYTNKFEPIRLEQPLHISFHLNREIPFQESPNIRDLGGVGTYSTPKRLKFRLGPGPDIDTVLELQCFLKRGRHMTPANFHAWLLSGDAASDASKGYLSTEIAGRRFSLRDAMAIMIETPILTSTPGVDNSLALGMWMQSALPVGIADKIEDLPTDSVYVEISPLDLIQPGLDENGDFARAVWLTRAGNEYVSTVFKRGPDGTYSFTFRYYYNRESGVFERVGSPESADAAVQAAQQSSLKGLFIVLTVLRDLSPGYKPPTTFGLIIDGQYIPAPLLEAQLAAPHRVPSTNYIVPKALDGTRYLRASGGPRSTPMLPPDPAVAFKELERNFSSVREPNYIAFAGAQLAEMYARARNSARAREVVDLALKAACSTNFKSFLPDLELLSGKIFLEFGEPKAGIDALSRAASGFKELGRVEEENEARSLLARAHREALARHRAENPGSPATTNSTMKFDVHYCAALPFVAAGKFPGDEITTLDEFDRFYRYVGTFEVRSLDKLVDELQNGGGGLGDKTMQQYVLRLVQHTSITSGDIAVERDSGRIWFIGLAGWREITLT